jgi:hypothetical protein
MNTLPLIPESDRRYAGLKETASGNVIAFPVAQPVSVTPQARPLPQPVDYGLTYYDVHLTGLGWMGTENPRDNLKYKPQGKWLSFLNGWPLLWAIGVPLYVLAFFTLFFGNYIKGGWSWSNPNVYVLFFGGMIMPGFLPGIFVVIILAMALERPDRRPGQCL